MLLSHYQFEPSVYYSLDLNQGEITIIIEDFNSCDRMILSNSTKFEHQLALLKSSHSTEELIKLPFLHQKITQPPLYKAKTETPNNSNPFNQFIICKLFGYHNISLIFNRVLYWINPKNCKSTSNEQATFTSTLFVLQMNYHELEKLF